MAVFWARFARRVTQVGNVTILENVALPMLEVNAAYSPVRIGQPREQPILICPADLQASHHKVSHHKVSQLEGDDLAGTLLALKVLPIALDSSLWVEQVAWTQAAPLARVWCEHNDARDWLALIARELARSLETHPDLLAYMAYENDTAVGMMIASSDGFSGLWAGADTVAHALFARGANDLGRLAVSVPLERSASRINGETARFNIWLNRHQPSDAQTKPLSDP